MGTTVQSTTGNTPVTTPHSPDLGHQPWCDVEDACVGPETASGSHYGRRHVMAWDPAVVGGRNEPELEELAVRPVLHHGHLILDIEVDTATSGCEDVMWLTPGEAQRYAKAILRAVAVIAPERATVTLAMSTLVRVLAVLEQVYADLVEAGAAEPWNAAEAVTLSAMHAEFDALRSALAER